MTEEAICKWFEGDDWQYESGWEKVQPLTRCKDCVHKNEYGYCTLYINFHHLTEDMGYCSDAERREE